MDKVEVHLFTSACGNLPRDPPTVVSVLIDQEMDDTQDDFREGSKRVAWLTRAIIK